MIRRTTLFAIGFCLLGCSAPSKRPVVEARAEVEGAASLRYVFEVSNDLAKLDTTVCFDGAPPSRFVSGVRGGEAMLLRAETVPGEAGSAEARALPHGEDGIDLAGVGEGACIRYALDLAGSSSLPMGLGSRIVDGALLSNPASWLWRAPRRPTGMRATARFVHAPEVEVAVSWPRDGAAHALDATAFGFYSHAAFGRFERETVSVGDATLDVVVLAGFSETTRAAIRPWITAVARMAATPGGRFPTERAQVIVIPKRRGGDAVGFGHVTRGGGASVALMVSPEAELDALLSDWTAGHEFSHLWHPFVRKDGVWLSEGLATYYQEIIRVRGGVLPAAKAWRRLRDGADRGKADDRSLAEASTNVYRNWDFPRVYWGGAAIALLADVEIRRRSDGARSLDDVMAELAKCCTRDSRAWPAERLVARMDEIIGAPVMAEIVKRHVNGDRFADLGPLYGRLGLALRDGVYEPVSGAPESAIRDAIMRVDPAAAPPVSEQR